MYIMFSTPLTCCSIGAATVSATTWALAPGYWQVTTTVGGAIGGYIAIGSDQSAIAPASVITIDRTVAKIGRSMKKRENTGWALVGQAVQPDGQESQAGQPDRRWESCQAGQPDLRSSMA